MNASELQVIKSRLSGGHNCEASHACATKLLAEVERLQAKLERVQKVVNDISSSATTHTEWTAHRKTFDAVQKALVD